MTKKEIAVLAVFLLFFSSLLSMKAQQVNTTPTTTSGDTANTDYLKGQSKRLRENCESLKTKARELITLYKGYVEKTKGCKGALEEAKLALDMAQKAFAQGEAGIKLADKADKSSKMKDTKKYLSQIEANIKSGHEYLTQSDERKKEIEFEMRGC